MAKKNFSYLIIAAVTLMTLGACANMAQGPTGGKSDATPPQLRYSTPNNGALGVNTSRVEIVFDEYLQLNDPSTNLVVSPPQKINPSAKAVGKKIVVELRDSLRKDVTYTFDFGNDIGDYTENNRVNDYLYSFSTGDHLDTLTISGTVLNASDLSPMDGVWVGVYSDDADSSFTTKPFERVGKTNVGGKFTIRGLAAKKYRVFALDDLNHNYFFDQPSEGVAVQEAELDIPSLSISEKIDTVYGDSMKIDTIIKRQIREYSPKDIVLRLYNEKINYQKFNKLERPTRYSFTIYMDKMEPSMPVVQLVDTTVADWSIPVPSKMCDTVQFWIKDSMLFKKDTIRLSVSYQETDSAGVLVSRTDTLLAALTPSFVKNEKKLAMEQEAKRKRYEKRKRRWARTNVLTFKQFKLVEINQLPVIEWAAPLSALDEKKIHVYLASDTTQTDLPITVTKNGDGRCCAYSVASPNLQPDSSYVLALDSACAYDYYGNHNNKEKLQFRMMAESEYAKLTFNISGVEGDAFVELLTASDMPIMTLPLKEGKASFVNVTPGTYFARLIVDANHNGVWDTGKYDEHLFPEQVYYFPKGVKLRANWDAVEDWDVSANPLVSQRPSDMKPKKKKDDKNK